MPPLRGSVKGDPDGSTRRRRLGPGAADRAAEILHDSHPFSTKRFKTDGRSIFAEIIQKTGEESLLDLVKSQYEAPSYLTACDIFQTASASRVDSEKNCSAPALFGAWISSTLGGTAAAGPGKSFKGQRR